MLTVAVFNPVVPGAKVTVKVAEFPGGMGETGESPPTVNKAAFVPDIVMELMLRLAVPGFWMVKVRTRLLLLPTFPKSV